MRILLLPLLGVLACKADGDADKGGPPGNDSPSVTITSPADGARVATPASVNLTGEADDPEDGTLPDDALAWTSDRDGPLGTGSALTVALSEGEHHLILTATDAGGATGTDAVTLLVSGDNLAPTPTILAPETWTVLREGDPLVLEGVASDPEDGVLPNGGLLWTSSIDGLWGQGSPLTVPAPSLGEHLVLLTAVDSLGAAGQAAVTVRVAGIGEDVAPFARIDAPADGATFAPATAVPLRGTGEDPETGTLSGAALTWTSDVDGALGTGAALDATLSAGLHTVTFTARDPGGQTATDTVLLVIAEPGNAAPVASIDAPQPGAVLPPTTSLRGLAEDAEDGTLPMTALAWRSSLGGPLGTGSPFDATLPLGAQTLTLIATDSAGGVGVDTVDVIITAPNTAPVATILQPADGSTFTAGTAIGFVGAGDDAEDGALPEANLFWQSSLDGPFAQGAAPSFAGLSAGAHTITLTVVDAQGASDSASLAITVTPAAAPLPPVAVLSLPPTGYVDLDVQADASASADADGDVVNWRFDWGDGTVPTVVTTGVASHRWANAGTFTVTVTVTDDDGLTDTTTATLDITVPVRVPTLVYDDVWPAGVFCDLALDASGEPRVLFGELGHDQVLYAERVGGVWQTTLVDGPGFLVGGALTQAGSLQLDAQGQPAGAWVVDDRVRYGTRSAAGVWTVEDVAIAMSDDAPVMLRLDPNTAGRPTLLFQQDVGSDRPAVATRATPGSWTVSAWTSLAAAYDNPVRGGAAWLPNGSLIFPMGRYDFAFGTWSPVTGFGGPNAIDGSSLDAYRHPVVVDPSGVSHILTGSGLYSRAVAPTWTISDVANTSLVHRALAWDPVANGPVAAFVNDQGLLEIVRPDGGTYWGWTYQGPADRAVDIDLEVDPTTGDARACFFRSGNLLVY
jgi:PKD repeat protein